MAIQKKDDFVATVVIFGYFLCAIIFTIWNWDNLGGNGPAVKIIHFIGLIVIGWVCMQFATSYNLDYEDLLSEINLDFEGTLGRASFWIVYLGLFAVVDVLLVSLDILIFGWERNYEYSDWLSYSMIASYFTILPTLALGTRRLHDTGRSGWWQLLYLTVIGILVLIVFWAQESKTSINKDSAIDPSKITNELERLSQMFKDGTISENEFTKAKSKLLD